MNLLAPIVNLFRSPEERQREAMIAQMEKQRDGAMKRVREAYDYADTVIADWERERDQHRREPGYRGDRKDGGYWPFITTMEDLRRYRGMSREACEGNGYGAGVLDRAVDFVIGDGMQPSVSLRGPHKGAVATGVADADGDGRPDADPAVENVQAVIDDFRRLNDWGVGEEDREEESFRRSQRDAEVCIRFFPGGGKANGIPFVRFVEPEQIDSPPSAEPHERWGIRTKPDDVESKEAWYVYEMDGTGGEWVDASEIVWHKLGTDRTVLRGMPQFWLVAQALSQCEKLNSAVTEVSAIQAQIAYVREHAPGHLPGQITDFVGSSGDVTGRKATPYGDKYRRVGYGENGTVVDMSSGMKFTSGPVSSGVPGFVQALQSRLRQVCSRFGYPEFFTGDASNGNYASLLAAGGPAERNFKRRQNRFAAFQAAVYRRACEYAVAAGRLSERDLWAVEIAVKPGKVSVSNNLEDAQIDQILIQNKVKSVQTVMQERGLDPRVESANLEAWDGKFGGGAMGLGGMGGDPFGGGGDDDGGGGGGPTFPGGGVGESVKREVGPPPFAGAVFDAGRHRWVKPGDTATRDDQEKNPKALGDGEHLSQKVDVPDPEGDDAFDVRVWTNPSDSQIRAKLDNLRSSQPIRGIVDGDDIHVWWEQDVHHQPTAYAIGVKKAVGFEDRLFIGKDDEGSPVVSTHAPNPRVAAWAKSRGYKYEGALGESLAGMTRYTGDEYEILSEAGRAGLVRKTLGTDKRGRKIVRWVRPDQDGGGVSRGDVDAIRESLDKAVKDPSSLTPESVALIEKHASELTVDERRKYAKAIKGAIAKPSKEPKAGGDVAPPKLTPEQTKAFFDYSEDIGYDLNATLREGDTPTGREKAVYDAVSKVIEEQGTIDPPLSVYRALSWSHPEDKAAFMRGVQAGGVVTLNGLQSTSLDREFVDDAFGGRAGGSVLMEIVASKGVRMAGEMTAHDVQREIVLPHGGRYRVIGVEQGTGGKTVVRMEQMA